MERREAFLVGRDWHVKLALHMLCREHNTWLLELHSRGWQFSSASHSSNPDGGHNHNHAVSRRPIIPRVRLVAKSNLKTAPTNLRRTRTTIHASHASNRTDSALRHTKIMMPEAESHRPTSSRPAGRLPNSASASSATRCSLAGFWWPRLRRFRNTSAFWGRDLMVLTVSFTLVITRVSGYSIIVVLFRWHLD